MAGITLGANIASLAAQRGLSDATSEVTQAYTRLSSGMRINKASDDAAGLSISAALNASAKIFTQAIRNINDAVSATSISEAALGSLSDIALRQVELAEQAANGSYSFAQRKAMNREADALTDEFNRIIQSTTFNGIELLSTFGTSLSIQAGVGANGVITGALNTALARGTGDGTFQSSISVAGLTSIQGISAGDFNGDGRLDFAISGGGRVSVRLGNGDGTFRFMTSISVAPYTNLSTADMNGDGYSDILTAGDTVGYSSVYLGRGDGTFQTGMSFTSEPTVYVARAADFNGDGVNEFFIGGASSDVRTYSGATQRVTTAKYVDLNSQTGARDALTVFQGNLDRITAEIGKLGAALSRFEVAANLNESLVVNLETAVSRIRDADVAQEVANMVRLQALQQANVALLAQTNLNSKKVLDLLA